ncbi:extracellular dioxygenase-like protein [Venturia nashicola]|nr:extracellular dioxygenase-like protein [Venturia nashicola]
MVQPSTLLTVLATGATIIRAHPGQSDESKFQEVRKRSEYISQLDKRDLKHCVGELSKRGEYHGMVSRRQEKLKALRRAKGFEEHAPHYKAKRQNLFSAMATYFGFGGSSAALQKSHKSNLTIADFSRPDWAMLGQNKTIVLHPEVTEGPYYVSGEKIRKNVKDGQAGVDLHLDIQVINMATCSPISGGVYSGVVDPMNGGAKAASTTNIINNQALRGFQITDNDGAIEFETIIPGHYRGRAHHIHIATHLNTSIQSNLTIASGSGQILHVGQLYLDQDLLNLVEKQDPYRSNKAPLTLNKEDALLMQGSAGGADPVLEYVLIGKEVGDGVFGWINFGVDINAKRKMRAASACDEGGCRTMEGGWGVAWDMFKGWFGFGNVPKGEAVAGVEM